MDASASTAAHRINNSGVSSVRQERTPPPKEASETILRLRIEPRLDERMALHMALNEAAQWHKWKVLSPMRGVMVHRLHNEIDMVYDLNANFPTHPTTQRLRQEVRRKVAGTFAPHKSFITACSRAVNSIPDIDD